MTKKEFMKIWTTLPEDEETKNYIPADTDNFVKISGYLFIVQKSGNVIMKKCGTSFFTVKEVLKAFRIWCQCMKIQYIRVEGYPNRYNCLYKMFPYLSIFKDKEVKTRNVFYIKLYD